MAQATEVIQAMTFWQGVKQNLAEVLWLKGWFCTLKCVANLSLASVKTRSGLQSHSVWISSAKPAKESTFVVPLHCYNLSQPHPPLFTASSHATKTFCIEKWAAFVRFWVINNPGLVVCLMSHSDRLLHYLAMFLSPDTGSENSPEAFFKKSIKTGKANWFLNYFHIYFPCMVVIKLGESLMKGQFSALFFFHISDCPLDTVLSFLFLPNYQ